MPPAFAEKAIPSITLKAKCRSPLQTHPHPQQKTNDRKCNGNHHSAGCIANPILINGYYHKSKYDPIGRSSCHSNNRKGNAFM